jgi:hypothetical protein
MQSCDTLALWLKLPSLPYLKHYTELELLGQYSDHTMDCMADEWEFDLWQGKNIKKNFHFPTTWL